MTVFSLWHVALTALVAGVASLTVLRWRFAAIPWREAVVIATGVGASVLGWRLAGNVGPLNDDPIPPVSPNDVLAPIATYVLLGVYNGLRPQRDPTTWAAAVAWLVAVSFVVNVIVI